MYGWYLGPLDVEVRAADAPWFPLGCRERPERGHAKLTIELTAHTAPPASEEYAQIQEWTAVGCRIVARRTIVEIDWQAATARWSWPIPESAYVQQDLRSSTALATLLALALRHGGVLLHGTSLTRGDDAVVASGPSGAGKSTLARRFHGRYLHDDTTLIMPSETGWQVWFQDIHRAGPGKHVDQARLKRLFSIDRDRSITAKRRLSVGDGLQQLLEQTYYATPWATQQLTGNLINLLESVPCYALTHCLASPLHVLECVLWD